jgi:hypothetical protein
MLRVVQTDSGQSYGTPPCRKPTLHRALSAGPEVLWVMALAEAEVLGHCHCFVEVAGQGVCGVRIARERDRAAASRPTTAGSMAVEGH